MKVLLTQKVVRIIISDSKLGKKIKEKLEKISVNDTLSQAPYPKLHVLCGHMYGTFALPINNRVRLIITPIDHLNASGNLFDKKNIIAINIGITFDHYEKIHSS